MRFSDWRLRETADLECGGLTPLSIFAFVYFATASASIIRNAR
jgi:hypothetical protein